eukprot:TRINITY_DN13398_c1_g4_i1.p1 TRINITY_DN13398_c1_g4~~TRINITY_DN13398_c1_g4_i1.p1  ORF type:complete len:472 (-),score=27.43 TRINITY_DN13398_c1_g4_i1:199-1566(-)
MGLHSKWQMRLQDSRIGNYVVLPTCLVSLLFTLVRTPGFRDLSSIVFRAAAGSVSLCNFAIYATAGTTNHVTSFARLSLVFHSVTCGLISECSLFGPVCWTVHFLFQIFYEILYGYMLIPGKAVATQAAICGSVMLAAGCYRLSRSSHAFFTTADRRLEEQGQEETAVAPVVPIAVMTLISMVVGSMVTFGIRYPEQFRDHPKLYECLKRCQACLIAACDRTCSSRCFRLFQKQDQVYGCDAQMSKEVHTSTFPASISCVLDLEVCKYVEELPDCIFRGTSCYRHCSALQSNGSACVAQGSVHFSDAVELVGVDLIVDNTRASQVMHPQVYGQVWEQGDPEEHVGDLLRGVQSNREADGVLEGVAEEDTADATDVDQMEEARVFPHAPSDSARDDSSHKVETRQEAMGRSEDVPESRASAAQALDDALLHLQELQDDVDCDLLTLSVSSGESDSD